MSLKSCLEEGVLLLLFSCLFSKMEIVILEPPYLPLNGEARIRRNNNFQGVFTSIKDSIHKEERNIHWSLLRAGLPHIKPYLISPTPFLVSTVHHCVDEETEDWWDERTKGWCNWRERELVFKATKPTIPLIDEVYLCCSWEEFNCISLFSLSVPGRGTEI